MVDTAYVILKNGEIQGVVLNSNTLATRALQKMRIADFEDAQKKHGVANAMVTEGPNSNEWTIVPTTVLTEDEI